eukprot:Blabericola_migrator_1__10071@NODE_5594_length_723_cov_335_672256_g3639_i0_p1_GENE_NODE_5594_length_723_cov_335_672256_g3639_i0NODE_5594_length_723_cov_335_672256_g3639_i0_p1_ORF_typecomplete_len111_score32_14Globin/PF00042_22/0_045Apolipoprotein/PF01442_18/0_013DUF3848/PF12959_7/0_021AIF_C/PF14721_6/0_033CRM1_C/PF08767_11/18CRM1_C/PF08767_11/2_6DUF883/PF05957_13/8_1e02DUF883/PF05957_13/0_094DUF4456/PF14644_6/0_052TetR_C_7/PF14246_6/0_082DUF148/PF02520_17/0_19DUF4279/PF14106_6/0_12CDT1_C/PF16679
MAQPDTAAKVQSMYADSLKKAKSNLKKGQVDSSLEIMAEFFEHQEELAEYFHHRSVEEVRDEMLDRLEQAQNALASIFAEYPERAKQFMAGLKKMVESEFDAFKEMKAAN